MCGNTECRNGGGEEMILEYKIVYFALDAVPPEVIEEDGDEECRFSHAATDADASSHLKLVRSGDAVVKYSGRNDPFKGIFSEPGTRQGKVS